MATKRKIPLNKIEGVTAGGTAIIDLPKNVRYHGICLQYNTNTAGGATEVNMEAEVGEIRVLLDEVTQRKASASELFDINRTKGKAPVVGGGTAPGYLPIFFSEPQRLTQVAQEATAWGMDGVGDFQIEVDIIDAAQVPNLKGFAIVDDVREAPAGIVKWKRNGITVSATGEIAYSLNLVNGDSHQGLFFFETNDGDIDDILLEWEGTKISQLTEYQQAAYIANFVNNAAQVSGLVHVPLDDNNPADALRSNIEQNGKIRRVQEVIATLNMAAANNVTLIRELIGVPD